MVPRPRPPAGGGGGGHHHWVETVWCRHWFQYLYLYLWLTMVKKVVTWLRESVYFFQFWSGDLTPPPRRTSARRPPGKMSWYPRKCVIPFWQVVPLLMSSASDAATTPFFTLWSALHTLYGLLSTLFDIMSEAALLKWWMDLPRRRPLNSSVAQELGDLWGIRRWAYVMSSYPHMLVAAP